MMKKLDTLSLPYHKGAGLLLACTVALLSGCSNSSSTESPEVQQSPATSQENTAPEDTSVLEEPETAQLDEVSTATPEYVRGEVGLRFALLAGQNALGAASLIQDNQVDATSNPYSITVSHSEQEIIQLLEASEIHVAAISTTAAAQLYHKGDAIQVLAVNAMMSLDLLQKGEQITALGEVPGKTIWASQEGSEYQILWENVLESAGIDPGAVTMVYLSQEEVMAKMQQSQDGICLLPATASTTLRQKDSSVEKALSVSDLWQHPLPIGCLVVQKAFLEEHPEEVRNFMTDFSISSARMAQGEESFASKAVEAGMASSLEEAQAYLADAKLQVITGSEMKESLERFYRLLFEVEGALLGGGMPYDDFYYSEN